VRYCFIIDQQPIGRLLFRRFCEISQKYQRYNNFLDVMDKYEVLLDMFALLLLYFLIELIFLKLEDIRREETAQEIYRRFLAPGAEESVEIINDDIIGQCKERLHEGSKDVFAACTAVVRDYLAGEPFKDFENSMYFHRYLQWKWLERYTPMTHTYTHTHTFSIYRFLVNFFLHSQPVTYKTFRMYRVLGKGGFGEVCACQVRATGKMYACKKLEKKRIKKRKGEAMVLIEKQILQRINSRFVVSFRRSSSFLPSF
jgi:G protein-coupled receptor kinase